MPGQMPGQAAAIPPDVTNLHLQPAILHAGVKHLGINLNGQNFYDSGQMLRNLVFKNPGFEGEIWQSILHCKTVTATTCTDENPYTVWPADFLKGGAFTVISGDVAGSTGKITASTAANGDSGVSITLNPAPKYINTGNFILVSVRHPGDAAAGWWTDLKGGATFATEFKDLSPLSPGHQALRAEASGPNQQAILHSYFDTMQGHSFLQLRGPYTLTFRAKALSGRPSLGVKVQRLDEKNGLHLFLDQAVALTPAWQDYTLTFEAAENGSALGGVDLSFTFAGTSALLDDVALTESPGPGHPTTFRDAVVHTLQTLKPGVLRYMDPGTTYGNTLDNMLAPPFARLRAGASTQIAREEDIPLGLHEFLTLAKAIGAEPWYTFAPQSTPAEAAELIEYLAGSASTPYGKRRAALGQVAPWTSVFPVIHLEFGNEEWNGGAFYGSSMANAAAYARRTDQLFAAARSSPSFRAQSFDLVIGSWAAVPSWTSDELSVSTKADSLGLAPYLFSDFNDGSSDEAIFGPMLAEPEMIDSRPNGYMAVQTRMAAASPHPVALEVYETNLGPISGSATQAQFNAAIPSVGAGLAAIDHMLLMLRDLGITTQNLYSLPGFAAGVGGGGGSGPAKAKITMPLWGSVLDMGGPTDRRRPSFLALQLANEAILPQMLKIDTSGANPTWNQPLSSNSNIELRRAHLLQSFAFADGAKHSLILLNLSRTANLPVTISGSLAPQGDVSMSQLTGARITDSNEESEQVRIERSQVPAAKASGPYQLPPFSMTTLVWQTQP
jgi:hypothetical protein